MSLFKGLYILTSSELLNVNLTIKLGMSMRLNQRVFDYYDVFSNAYNPFCYVLPDRTKEQILAIESEVLNKTSDKRNRNFTTEWRYITTEFGIKEYHDLIISILNYHQIKYDILQNPHFEKPKDMVKEPLDRTEELKDNIVLRDYQIECLNDALLLYKTNTSLMLNWACGLGKTIMSLIIASKYMTESKYILIGVPSLRILAQWKIEIKKIFPEYSILIVCDDISDEIIDKWKKENLSGIVLTTYHSSYKVYKNFNIFDFAIYDECHHLNSDRESFKEYSHKFIDILRISATKKLYLTATLKDKSSIPILDKKSILWAINNKFITDYNLIILDMTNEELDMVLTKCNIETENRELFISAYMTLLSMRNISHVLIYTNKIKNAEIVNEFIKKIINAKLIDVPKNLYHNSLHSLSENVDGELEKFIKSEYGIISCVHIFGEGLNVPEIDCVVFAENMESEIRITQYALRCCRLGKPNKIANMIIPIISSDIFTKSNNTFTKVINVIRKMSEDDNSILDTKLISISTKFINKINFVDPKLDLTKDMTELIKLEIKHRLTLINTLPQEYAKIRHYNKSQKFKTKKEYDSVALSHPFYIPNPHIYFYDIWISYTHFLGINISLYAPTIPEWKRVCEKYNINSLKDYQDKVQSIPELPLEPSEHYKNFSSLQEELNICDKLSRR